MSETEQTYLRDTFCFRYYLILMPLLCFLIPTTIPIYVWNESFKNSFFVATLLRYAFTLNVTWLVNSAAHMFGAKPYDKYVFSLRRQFCAF